MGIGDVGLEKKFVFVGNVDSYSVYLEALESCFWEPRLAVGILWVFLFLLPKGDCLFYVYGF